MRVLADRIRRAVDVLVAALREIFDEASYERFLALHQLGSSAGAYADFCRDQEQSNVRRPRCC
jgi:hypothetical protein